MKKTIIMTFKCTCVEQCHSDPGPREESSPSLACYWSIIGSGGRTASGQAGRALAPVWRGSGPPPREPQTMGSPFLKSARWPPVSQMRQDPNLTVPDLFHFEALMNCAVARQKTLRGHTSLHCLIQSNITLAADNGGSPQRAWNNHNNDSSHIYSCKETLDHRVFCY